jgi:threonine dehydratase
VLRNLIGESRNVTEFNYRYNDKGDFLAHVYLAFEIADTAEVKPLMEGLEAKNFGCIDLTDNEAAKLHIRHLVGGRCRDNGVKERILRFEFPEVPGASINFLQVLSGNGDFNISLFHYRSHGSDVGRVLAGF